jgi:ribose-phosphate pyrophosphokinase
MDRGRLSIVACQEGRTFAERVVAALREEARTSGAHRGTSAEQVAQDVSDLSIRGSKEVWFSAGEVKTEVLENIRGDDVYVFQSLFEPHSERSVNDSLMALLTAVNAAHQSDAETVTAVVPLFPYARQERKRGREGVTAAQVAQFLEVSGARRVITMDVHAEAVVSAFRQARFENLHAARVIFEHIRRTHLQESLVVVSPDAGGAHRARFYAKLAATEFALIDKVRDYSKPGTIAEMRLVGQVAGKNALVVDDMVDTGGSIVRAVQTLKDKGAKDVFVACTHPLFSGEAVERLDRAVRDGLVRKVIGTDSVIWSEHLRERGWYEEVSVAHLFAAVIWHINQKLSVSELLR